MKLSFICFYAVLIAGLTACQSQTAVSVAPANDPAAAAATPAAVPPSAYASSSPIPNLQAEIEDSRHSSTNSPIGKFDFKNFSYPLPRGWENPDGSEITLVNGRRPPVMISTDVDSTDEEKAAARENRRIGMSYVTTKYMDVNNDGEDEALVVLKIETAGSAIPQVVYVYSWKDGQPELFWSFRTGDRTDGGLKDMRVENGDLVIELYGQDRFLLGQSETGKITGDYEQLCCPVYFTRSFYKWNGKTFLMQGKRLTFKVADPSAPPVENMADIVNKQAAAGRKK